LVGDIERCEVQSETRDLREKCIEVTTEASEVKVCKVGEPFEEAVKKRPCRIIDFE
jgi:hypothetical protein